MKKFSIAFIVLLVLVACWNSVSFAAVYISGSLGGALLEDSDALRDRVVISSDPGFSIGAAIGHTYDLGFRTEVALGYQANDLDKIEVSGRGPVTLNGDITSISLMLNGYYDYMLNEKFYPFLGLGAGIANIEAEDQSLGSDDKNVLIYQASAGVAVAVGEKTKLDVLYRYSGTEGPEFRGLEVDYNTHNVMIGLRRSF